ncbi:MAG: hypothetical protein JO199_09170 [Candidatus Eremiobacteraeota bacterium]|nr:hypothetical protein [Candidatus Eremiobacteraeota bacterium]
MFTASLVACSQSASGLPPTVGPAFNQHVVAHAAPTLKIAFNGVNARFATGSVATGVGFGGLLVQGVKLSVSGGTGTYKYALTSSNAAVVAVAGTTAGQFTVTPKAEIPRIFLKATATPATGKAVVANIALQIAPLVYVASYPGSGGGKIGVYAPWSKDAIVAVNESGPLGITVDGKGNVWLANTTTVEEYTAGLLKHVRTIAGFTKASDVAVDGLGNAYCEDFGKFDVTEYAPNGGSTPSRTFGNAQGITGAQWVAVDSLNDLYIADYYAGVLVYGPGSSTTPLRTLSNGVVNPRMAVVAGQNLYVANNAPNQTIPRFPVGSTTPSLTFGTGSGLAGASNLAVDDKGDLYASIDNIGAGNALEYTPVSHASPSRTFALTGGGNPVGLATDSLGNLYVANGINYIDVFAPGTSTTPHYSIGCPSCDIYSPDAVAVWP